MISMKNFSQVLGPGIAQKLHLLKLQMTCISSLVLLDLSAAFNTIQVHLILEFGEKAFSCNLFQTVKLSYIIESLHVK